MAETLTSDFISESIRLIRASERLGAIGVHLAAVRIAAEQVREVAPELDQELQGVTSLVDEITQHLVSATGALDAQVKNL